MKQLLLFFSLLMGFTASYAQSIVVNRYFNSATGDGTGDVVELVVVQDHLDIRKWIIKDHGNGTAGVSARLDEGGAKYRFNDIPFWGNLRSGTVIVIRTLADAAIATYTPDVDASDFIVDVAINDTNFFIALSPSTVKFNVTPHEAVMIRADVTEITGTMTLAEKNVILNGANMAVHALGYGDFLATAGNSWNNIKSPKAIFTNGSPGTYVSNGTVGMVTLTNPNVANYNTPLTKSTPLINSLPAYWVQQTSLTANMPYGIEVYKSTTNYSYNAGPTRKMNAFCVVIDPKFVEFKPTFGNPNKSPTAFQNDEAGTVLAVMNAGFFQAGGSFSIIKHDGVTTASNVAQLTRTFNGNATAYYPTRAALGLSPSKTPDVAWIYNVSGVVYAYPTPSANALNVAPKPQPIAGDGVIWNNVTAVGGSPMLIKGGNINITDVEELIVIDNASARARSAIGYTADGKIVMLAVEGNNAGVSDGLSLVELANYMKDMGCVGAINLDGGGSTTLRVGAQAMFTPSDGTERAMASVILIKAKN